MKKLFNKVIASMLVVSGVFAMGCQEYGIDSQPEAAPAIQEDSMESYIMVAESASPVVFNISSNTPWRIERDAEWLTVTPSMSATSSLVSEVKISAADNTATIARSATVKIIAPEAAYEKVITVNQASKTDFLITELGRAMKTEGGEAEFKLYTNKAWQYVAISDVLAGKADVTSGKDTEDVMEYVIKIQVPENEGVVRTLRFLIRTESGDHECIINQNGITLQFEEGQDELYALGAFIGMSQTYIVDTSVKTWTVETDVDWLDVTADSEAKTVTVTTKSLNPYFAPRTGTIVLKSQEVKSEPIQITQASLFAIRKDSASERTINEDGSVKYVVADANALFYATQPYNGRMPFEKGRLTIEFGELKLSGTTLHIALEQEPQDVYLNANHKIWLSVNPSSTDRRAVCGGPAYVWVQNNFPDITAEMIPTLKRVIIEMKDSSEGAHGYVINDIFEFADGKKFEYPFKGINNPFETAGFVGHGLHVNAMTPTKGDIIEIKSITWEPAK